MTGRFSRLPAAAVLDLELSAEALRVLAMLGCYADKYGYCWPAVTTMARRLGLHRTTVQRHLRKLEARGYVDRTETYRATRGGFGRNRYGLNYPAMPSLKADEADAAPDAASPPNDASNTLASADTMLHQTARDAAPDASTDAAPHAAQTIPLNYPTENKPNGPAHVRSRRDGIITFEDGSWIPDPDEPDKPSPTPAPTAQQRKSPTQAPMPKWERPKRPSKPTDHTTEMAKHLAVVPGFDRKLAWEAILALPSEVQVRLERGDLQLTELLDELKRLDLGDSATWRRAQQGLGQVGGDAP